MKNRIKLFLTVTVLIILTTTVVSAEVLKMATTTSTDNTGLLDVLAPEFKKDTGIELQWVAVGTGKALAIGRNCDVDILMVHAPGAEKKFLAGGHGDYRKEVMYNDFVIIGPKSDPAGIKGNNVTAAFKKMNNGKNKFLSRGDNSGTNKKEIKLWETANNVVPEKESWYVQTGQGMLSTINMAAEMNGYTLTDRGTFIKYSSVKSNTEKLILIVEKDASLLNTYSVIPINHKKCTSANNAAAETFVKWITSNKGQKMIGDFRLLGKRLFTPSAK